MLYKISHANNDSVVSQLDDIERSLHTIIDHKDMLSDLPRYLEPDELVVTALSVEKISGVETIGFLVLTTERLILLCVAGEKAACYRYLTVSEVSLDDFCDISCDLGFLTGRIDFKTNWGSFSAEKTSDLFSESNNEVSAKSDLAIDNFCNVLRETARAFTEGKNSIEACSGSQIEASLDRVNSAMEGKSSGKSTFEQISEAAQLFQNGLLSEQEYQRLKEDLLK